MDPTMQVSILGGVAIAMTYSYMGFRIRSKNPEKDFSEMDAIILGPFLIFFISKNK